MSDEQPVHAFMFSPGNWQGDGTVVLNTSPESLPFHTEWAVGDIEDEGIPCEQQVKLAAADQVIVNKLRIFAITKDSFSIELVNDMIQGVVGRGILDGTKIAWEFRDGDFEGFEVYELLEDGKYKFHAEYLSSSSGQYRTIINGILSKKEQTS